MLGLCGTLQRGTNHGFFHDIVGVVGLLACRVFVHQAGEQCLIHAAPVDPDANCLVVAAGVFNHGGKLAAVIPVFSFDKMLAAIANKTYDGDYNGLPIERVF